MEQQNPTGPEMATQHPPRVYYKVERNSRGVTWSTHVEASPGEAERLLEQAVAYMGDRYGAVNVERAGEA
tara:strand:+ start:685 stop:894 length:210 start_codon:yes stop_codon:yes gene_type:complete